jgi:hypothetical protein
MFGALPEHVCAIILFQFQCTVNLILSAVRVDSKCLHTDTLKFKGTSLCCLRHKLYNPFWFRNKLTGIVRDTQIGASGQKIVRGWNMLFLIDLLQQTDQPVTTFLSHATWTCITLDVIPSVEYHIISLWTVIYWGDPSVTDKTSPTGLGWDCFYIWCMAGTSDYKFCLYLTKITKTTTTTTTTTNSKGRNKRCGHLIHMKISIYEELCLLGYKAL